MYTAARVHLLEVAEKKLAIRYELQTHVRNVLRKQVVCSRYTQSIWRVEGFNKSEKQGCFMQLGSVTTIRSVLLLLNLCIIKNKNL